MDARARLYLETSFWNRLGDDVLSPARRITYRFLNRRCVRVDLVISPLVLEEIRQTPDPRERRLIVRQLQGARPLVVSGEARARAIARELQREGPFGPGMTTDLVHVGYAILARVDALVTWDRRTLARDKVRRAVGAFGRRNGVPVPLLGIPEDVAKWLGSRMAP